MSEHWYLVDFTFKAHKNGKAGNSGFDGHLDAVRLIYNAKTNSQDVEIYKGDGKGGYSAGPLMSFKLNKTKDFDDFSKRVDADRDGVAEAHAYFSPLESTGFFFSIDDKKYKELQQTSKAQISEYTDSVSPRGTSQAEINYDNLQERIKELTKMSGGDFNGDFGGSVASSNDRLHAAPNGYFLELHDYGEDPRKK